LFQAIHGVVVEPFLPELLAECAFSGAMGPEIAFATAVVIIYGPSWETVITCILLVFFNSSSSSPLTPLPPPPKKMKKLKKLNLDSHLPFRQAFLSVKVSHVEQYLNPLGTHVLSLRCSTALREKHSQCAVHRDVLQPRSGGADQPRARRRLTISS
jgi:hypothetical protein